MGHLARMQSLPWLYFPVNLASFYFLISPCLFNPFLREALKSQIHLKEVQLQKEKEIMLARCDKN